jgi:hypothetical protein
VEGAQPSTLVHYSENDRLQISENLTGGNPHRVESKFLQKIVSSGVARGSITPTVSLSVDFHRKPCFKAGEIK